jgi:hypothetical protein
MSVPRSALIVGYRGFDETLPGRHSALARLAATVHCSQKDTICQSMPNARKTRGKSDNEPPNFRPSWQSQVTAWQEVAFPPNARGRSRTT